MLLQLSFSIVFSWNMLYVVIFYESEKAAVEPPTTTKFLVLMYKLVVESLALTYMMQWCLHVMCFWYSLHFCYKFIYIITGNGSPCYIYSDMYEIHNAKSLWVDKCPSIVPRLSVN